MMIFEIRTLFDEMIEVFVEKTGIQGFHTDWTRIRSHSNGSLLDNCIAR